jgi:hypothetical protein
VNYVLTMERSGYAPIKTNGKVETLHQLAATFMTRRVGAGQFKPRPDVKVSVVPVER